MTDLGWQPVGAILPFVRGRDIGPATIDDLWKSWMEIDGQKLEVSQYPELAQQLTHRPETVEIWEGLGGAIDDEFITMPPKLAFPEFPDTMVLIKVK